MKKIYCILPLIAVCLFSCKTRSSESNVLGINTNNALLENYWGEFLPKDCRYDKTYSEGNYANISSYDDPKEVMTTFFVLPDTCKDPTNLTAEDSDSRTKNIDIVERMSGYTEPLWCKYMCISSRVRNWYVDDGKVRRTCVLNPSTNKIIYGTGSSDYSSVDKDITSFFTKNINKWIIVFSDATTFAMRPTSTNIVKPSFVLNKERLSVPTPIVANRNDPGTESPSLVADLDTLYFTFLRPTKEGDKIILETHQIRYKYKAQK